MDYMCNRIGKQLRNTKHRAVNNYIPFDRRK